MTYANNLDPDEAPQNVGLHLRFKLFDIQIIQMKPHKMWGFIWDPNCLTFRLYISKIFGRKHWFFASFERTKYLKKLPSMQIVKPTEPGELIWCDHMLWKFQAIYGLLACRMPDSVTSMFGRHSCTNLSTSNMWERAHADMQTYCNYNMYALVTPQTVFIFYFLVY